MKPLTFREFIVYIRDNPVIKTRLTALVGTAVLGLASVVALAIGDWVVSVACLVAMLAVAAIGYNA